MSSSPADRYAARQRQRAARRRQRLATPEADVICAPGWPRKTVPYTGVSPSGRPQTSMPVPWVNATEVVGDDNWLGFRPDCHQAIEHRLCAFCGEVMPGTVLLGNMNASSAQTSGPGLHARCMLMAVKVCPHFRFVRSDDTVVAWRYNGDGPGYDVPDDRDVYEDTTPVDPSCTPVTVQQLRALAAADPLGDGSETKTSARQAHR